MTESFEKSFERLKPWVKAQLSAHRWQHTLGVIDTIEHMAHRFGADVQQARLAALLHDAAKGMDLEEMQRFVRASGANVPDSVFDSRSLLHAEAGALMAEQAGVDDPEILAAIRCHTTGKVGMNLLDKLLYLADFIEPGRSFPGLQEIRHAAAKNVDETMLLAVSASIRYLLDRREYIDPRTLEVYHDVLDRQNEKPERGNG